MRKLNTVHLLLHQFSQLTITGLAVGSVYALIALGYTMVYGVLQLINFAHSEVFMFGTFAVAWVAMAIHGPNSVSESLGHAAGILLVGLVAAMLLSGAVGLVLERVAYRPLIKKKAPKIIALISAIGAAFALEEIMGLRDRIAHAFGLEGRLANYVAGARNPYTMPVTVQPHNLFPIGNYEVTDVDLLMIVAALGMMVLLESFVKYTKYGKGIRAVAQDPEAAALMGVNSTRVVQLTFLIGGLMAGVAAVLYMVRIGSTTAAGGDLLGVKAFTAAVMGGIGNLRGALIGGLVLGVAENWGAAVLGDSWKDVVSFVLLVLILLVRPSGILGEALGKARA